jgi:hypothetical protein
MAATKDHSEATFIIEVAPLTSTRILQEDPTKLSLLEQVQSHVILNKLGKAIEARLKTLRIPLIAVTKANGKSSEDSSTIKYVVDGSSVCVERRKKNEPDPTKLQALLVERKLDIHEAFDDVTVLQLNMSKLSYLVQTGKLKEEEVQQICAEIPALRIYPSKALKEAVASLNLASKTEDEAGQSCLPPDQQ